MNKHSAVGLYGKLPAYGDFIFRNLNPAFINPWDEWLQHFIAASQESIGETWLDVYLTSPIWRFSLSPGVIDNNVWCGIIMPSVDRVGRYFPISIVKSFDNTTNPVKFMLAHSDWYTAIEDTCLKALDGSIDADQLVEMANQVSIQTTDDYSPTINLGEQGSTVIAVDAINDTSLNSALPYMLNASLSSQYNSFSLWHSTGSERITPSLFSSQGLPAIASLASMLDGQWQDRGWKIPYNNK